jgi:uncharacterized membrane protein required for colicin V production
LIRAVGNLIGLIAGAYIASHIYLRVYEFLDKIIPGNPDIGKVVVFVVIFTLISRIISWLITLLEQLFNVISIIPFLKTANRVLGLLFGLAEGIFSLGVAFYILNRHLPEAIPLAKWIGHSHLAPWLIKVSKLLAPILPEVFNRLQNLI